jgi:hypothetical protein
MHVLHGRLVSRIEIVPVIRTEGHWGRGMHVLHGRLVSRIEIVRSFAPRATGDEPIATWRTFFGSETDGGSDPPSPPRGQSMSV